jgi:riboflavin kinase / FMN adenylyltransferase
MSSLGSAAVAIGVFDGVHVGHQALLRDTVADAAARNIRAIAVTFDRDPDQIVSSANAAPQLLTLADKLDFIAESGIGLILVVPFTPTLAEMAPESFVDSVLLAAMRPVAVHVGRDFRFGARATGDVGTLQRLGMTHAFDVWPHDLVEAEGAPVTSTRIRALVASGDIAGAAVLLGHRPRVAGTVHRGRGEGVKLGFPTANVVPVPFAALPSNGVYAGRAILEDGVEWAAAISVGAPPSFPEARDYLEAHLIDFEGDLYDQAITLEFWERLRDQQSYASGPELTEAIARDVMASLEIAGFEDDDEDESEGDFEEDERAVAGGYFASEPEEAADPRTLTEYLGDLAQAAGVVGVDGRPVLATRSAELMAIGDVVSAAVVLGSKPIVAGLVHPGRGDGAKMGFPTANVELTGGVLPANGVYAGRAILQDGIEWAAAISVGTPPMFPDSPDYLEAHLVDYDGNLYGQAVTLEFWERLRDLEAYDTIDELKTAIGEDVASSLEIAGFEDDEDGDNLSDAVPDDDAFEGRPDASSAAAPTTEDSYFAAEPVTVPSDDETFTDSASDDVSDGSDPVFNRAMLEAAENAVRQTDRIRRHTVDDDLVVLADNLPYDKTRLGAISAALTAADIEATWDPYPPENAPLLNLGILGHNRFRITVWNSQLEQARAVFQDTDPGE